MPSVLTYSKLLLSGLQQVPLSIGIEEVPVNWNTRTASETSLAGTPGCLKSQGHDFCVFFVGRRSKAGPSICNLGGIAWGLNWVALSQILPTYANAKKLDMRPKTYPACHMLCREECMVILLSRALTWPQLLLSRGSRKLAIHPRS